MRSRGKEIGRERKLTEERKIRKIKKKRFTMSQEKEGGQKIYKKNRERNVKKENH